MNPMIMIVVFCLLWLVSVFPLYLHYRKEISIRSKSISLISGKVVGYNSSIYSRYGEPPNEKYFKYLFIGFSIIFLILIGINLFRIFLQFEKFIFGY